MAIRVTTSVIANSMLYTYGGNRGLADLVSGWRDDNIGAQFRVDELYPLSGHGIIAGGEQMFADTAHGQLFFMRGDFIRLIAGRYGVVAHKDGPGNVARLAMGGLQGAMQFARDSHGAWYFPQAKFSCISKAVEQPDESWVISTWYSGINSDSLAIDANDNIYVSSGGVIRKITPSLQTTDYPMPFTNVIQIEVRGQNALLCTRFNSWDVVMRMNLATGQIVRIAGMTQEEIDAYAASHGGVVLVDGPLINGATLHSAGLVWVSDDTRQWMTLGGDERQFRLWNEDEGVTRSLYVDSSWRVSQERITQPHPNTDPNRPFYSGGGGGRQANGLPAVSTPIFFEPWGLPRWGATLELTTIPDPPPGGNVEGYQDPLINGGKTAVGWALDGVNTVTVQIVIDGVHQAMIPTDILREDVNAAYGVTGNHGFQWNIPAQFGDGQNHSLDTIANGVRLHESPRTFNFQSGGGDMDITKTLQYGDQSVPAGIVLHSIVANLMSNGTQIGSTGVPPGATTVTFTNVQPGTYTIQLTNFDQNGQPIGATVNSAPIVVGPDTDVISIVVSIN